jgi:uncharacterized protein YcfL
MQFRSLTVGLMLIGLIAAAGCTGVLGGQADTTNPYPKVTVTAKELYDGLAFNPATMTRTQTGMLAVSQPIRARANEPLMIEYRFVWLDAAGVPLSPQPGWVYKRLEPRIPETLSANSSSKDAVDYQIHVRWARP